MRTKLVAIFSFFSIALLDMDVVFWRWSCGVGEGSYFFTFFASAKRKFRILLILLKYRSCCLVGSCLLFSACTSQQWRCQPPTEARKKFGTIKRGDETGLFFLLPAAAARAELTEGEEKLAAAAAAADVTQNGQTTRRRGLLFWGEGGSQTLSRPTRVGRGQFLGKSATGYPGDSGPHLLGAGSFNKESKYLSWYEWPFTARTYTWDRGKSRV